MTKKRSNNKDVEPRKNVTNLPGNDGWELPVSKDKLGTDKDVSEACDRSEIRDDVDLSDTEGFEMELRTAKDIKGKAGTIISDIMLDVRMGKCMDSSSAEKIVEAMVDSIFRNKDAITSLSMLKDYDHYTYGHSVNVCILSLALGRHIGLDKQALMSLGLGALLHDTGKMRLKNSVLNKVGKLTEYEFEHIKEHSMLGASLLSECADIKEETIEVVLQHHERSDGSGYPHKLTSDDIHLYAKIVSIVDVYDAMTSRRIYKTKQCPTEVIKGIFALSGDHFDQKIVERFVQSVGIYPIGTIVRLETGETALIRDVNRNNLLEPTVVVFADSRGRKYQEPKEIQVESGTGRGIISSVNAVKQPFHREGLC